VLIVAVMMMRMEPDLGEQRPMIAGAAGEIGIAA
jgi:hypothetical protein